MNARSHRCMDLVVIGAGIHGCSAAMFAAMQGLSVTVVEKDSVGRHASGVNAGGVRRLWRHFAELPVSVRSMEIWHGISDLVGDDCGFQVSPQIRLALNEDDLALMSDRVDRLNQMGFVHEKLVSTEEIRRYIPDLTQKVVGGIACLDDGFAQPFQTTFAIYRRARALGC